MTRVFLLLAAIFPRRRNFRLPILCRAGILQPPEATAATAPPAVSTATRAAMPIEINSGRPGHINTVA
jgi:hypothetical protein